MNLLKKKSIMPIKSGLHNVLQKTCWNCLYFNVDLINYLRL